MHVHDQKTVLMLDKRYTPCPVRSADMDSCLYDLNAVYSRQTYLYNTRTHTLTAATNTVNINVDERHIHNYTSHKYYSDQIMRQMIPQYSAAKTLLARQ